MFQLADPKKPVKWPVKVKVPTDKGEVEKSFAVSFYFRTEEQIKALNEKLDDVKFLQDVVAAFHELKDHLGKPIKGTKADVKKVCSNTRVRLALIDAFFDFNHGDLKN